MQNLRDLAENEIGVLVREAGQPAYRAGQIFKWAQSGARSFDEMTDVPQSPAGLFGGALYGFAACPAQTANRTRRDAQIPLGPFRRQLYRDGADGI